MDIRLLVALGLGMIALGCFYLHTQNHWVKTEYYKVKIQGLPTALKGLRIVHISDTHYPQTAIAPDALVSLVKKQSPDLILMTGDLLDTNEGLPQLDVLARGLSAVAPCYAVYGNHDVFNATLSLWEKTLTENGITVLKNELSFFEKDGASLALIGLINAGQLSQKLLDMIKSPAIVLTHKPSPRKDTLDAKRALPALILCGHAHGGQVRVPFIGGLFAPDQGLFPALTSGLYAPYGQSGTQRVLSRGLGASRFPFRVNNRVHLPVIELE